MEARCMKYGTIGAKACPMHIKLKYQQATRRQEYLNLQKLKREQQIFNRRHLENDAEINFMEIDEKKNGSTMPNSEAYELATNMMYSEWMLEVPIDIDDWIAVLCPVGKRCCVIAQDNKTMAFNKFGTFLSNFPSLFPYGCHLPNSHPIHRKRIVLDCVFNYTLKKYYILDIIEWMGIPYTDFDVDFRFYFIQSKLSEIPGIDVKSNKNLFPFEMAPRMVTRDLYPLLFEKCEFFPENVELDGINFYHSESLYTPGETPLVLWLKPFMVPDVLQKPVNDLLAQLKKPPNYVNIFEYTQSLKKKSRKKKNSINHNNMEVDSLVEMEVDKNPIHDSDMLVKT